MQGAKVDTASAPSSESLQTLFDAECECKIEVFDAVQQVVING